MQRRELPVAFSDTKLLRLKQNGGSAHRLFELDRGSGALKVRDEAASSGLALRLPEMLHLHIPPPMTTSKNYNITNGSECSNCNSTSTQTESEDIQSLDLNTCEMMDSGILVFVGSTTGYDQGKWLCGSLPV